MNIKNEKDKNSNSPTDFTNSVNRSKKRKLKQNKCKNTSIVLNTNNNCMFDKEKFELIVYVKTLLDIYKNLPNIIAILDKIIERKASSLTSTSSIYGNIYLETYNQVNKVINLTDRKDKLLNLYVIIENILKSLKDNDRKVIVLKFIQKNTSLEIAKEMKISERTVFRRINVALDKIVDFMLNQNWNIDFLKHQVGKESWIEDAFNQKLKEEIISRNKNKKLQ